MTSTVKVRKMPIMEIFGPTIQGEGMVIGRKTMFVRTGGCDYACAWCDSAFTWNGEQKADMFTAQEIFNKLMELGSVEVESRGDFMSDAQLIRAMSRNFDHVTLTGGNPALVGEAMEQLIDMLHGADIAVGLETQGSKWQNWFEKIDDLTLSPKPPSSTMKTNWGMLDNIITRLEKEGVNYSIKVVVFDDADFEYAKFVHQRYPNAEFFLSVGNIDSKEAGDISGRLLQKLGWLWDKVLADPEMNDAKPLPQLHTLVWANKRGV